MCTVQNDDDDDSMVDSTCSRGFAGAEFNRLVAILPSFVLLLLDIRKLTSGVSGCTVTGAPSRTIDNEELAAIICVRSA